MPVQCTVCLWTRIEDKPEILKFEVWGWRFWQLAHVTFHVKENSMMHPLVSNCIKWVTSNVWGDTYKIPSGKAVSFFHAFKKLSKNSRSFGSFGSFGWENESTRTFHCQWPDLVSVTIEVTRVTVTFWDLVLFDGGFDLGTAAAAHGHEGQSGGPESAWTSMGFLLLWFPLNGSCCLQRIK